MRSVPESRNACAWLMKYFENKFGTYGLVRHKRSWNKQWEFVLQVKSLSKAIATEDDVYNYYRMGATKEAAIAYIDRIKQVPIGTLTFDTLEEAEKFKRNQRREERKRRKVK